MVEENGGGIAEGAGGIAPPHYMDLHQPPDKRTWRNAKIKDKSVWFKCDCGPLQLALNPVVTLCSVVIIIAFILWCILEPNHAITTFKDVKLWITQVFCWFYVGSQDIWAIVLIAIYFSKYGDVKLGKDDEKPVYSDGTWFAMLFSCGIGVGLFFFGVAEPVWHYIGPNRYTADKYMPDNELAQWAINLTYFHWGLHGWVVYVMVGMIMGFMAFRKGLPMTMKSCFYPLIGDRIYGWVGDFIDIFSVLTTLFGVCTSLGLGTRQVNLGLNFIDSSIEISTTNQVIIIWGITLVATISVITGVGIGIRRLSEICFGLGMLIMLMVFFMDDTWYLLNVFCQSVGFYLQWLVQLGFHTDAFEISTQSYGASDRGREYEATEGDGPASWMNDWTIFYWGWWISWSPFVGMFMAKISRGRTMRNFINGALTAPILYSFMWMAIFGGAGIRIEREAAEMSLCCPSFNGAFLAESRQNLLALGPFDRTTLKACNDPASSEGVVCSETSCEWIQGLGLYADSIANEPAAADTSYKAQQFILQSQSWLGKYISATDKSHARLSCMPSEEMWFAAISTYGDMGHFLCIISLIGILLYFVTSSDSGSLVIDIISANGNQNPPVLQRIFWALVEGATATALLVAGGSESLQALQAASVAAGLPYTVVLCFLTVSLWRALAMECGDLNPYGPDFAVSIIDPFTQLKPKLWVGVLANLFLAPVTLYNSLKEHKLSALSSAVMAAVSWLAWIALIIAAIVEKVKGVELAGIYSIAWVFYIGFVTVITVARCNIRSLHGINGNPVEDFFACLFLYPCVMIQLQTVSQPNGIAPLLPDADDAIATSSSDMVMKNLGNGESKA